MRGLGAHLSAGERIAFYGKRRGYTREVLAGLVVAPTGWGRSRRGAGSLPGSTAPRRPNQRGPQATSSVQYEVFGCKLAGGFFTRARTRSLS